MSEIITIEKSLYEAEERCDIQMLKCILRILYSHDCEDLAWRLIRRFGSFNAIFSADYEDLIAVKGMNERSAEIFAFAKPAFRQAILRRTGDSGLNCEAALIKYVLSVFINESGGQYCLYVDKKDRVTKIQKMNGDEVREALLCSSDNNVAKLAVIGGTPYGTKPALTRKKLKFLIKIIKPLTALGIEFIDYIEYSPFRFVSARRVAEGDLCRIDVSEASGERYGAVDLVPGLEREILRLDDVKRRAYW